MSIKVLCVSFSFTARNEITVWSQVWDTLRVFVGIGAVLTYKNILEGRRLIIKAFLLENIRRHYHGVYIYLSGLFEATWCSGGRDRVAACPEVVTYSFPHLGDWPLYIYMTSVKVKYQSHDDLEKGAEQIQLLSRMFLKDLDVVRVTFK